jgi:hypothetical protein
MRIKPEIMKKYHKITKFYDLKTIFKFLELIRQSGIINMFTAAPFLYNGKEFLENEIKRYYGNTGGFSLFNDDDDDEDEDDEDRFKEVIDMAGKVRDLMIYGATKMITDTDSENYMYNIKRRLMQDSQEIVKIWMSFKGNVVKENVIVESKYDKKTAAKFLFRRVTKEELDEEFEENYKYFRDFWGQLTHRDKPFSEFKRIYITYIMDSIHGKLIDGFLDIKDETGELYDNVLKIIDEIYGDRIAKLWTQKTGERV